MAGKVSAHPELRVLAEACSKGPWWPSSRRSNHYVAPGESFNPDKDSRFIAVANPARILSLLDEIDRLKAALEAREDAEDQERQGYITSGVCGVCKRTAPLVGGECPDCRH